MLDNFLELSIETDDIGATFEALRSLGFGAVPVGDIRGDGYALVSEGSFCIGLHARRFDGPALCFVRPNLADHVRALRRKDIELEFARLGDQEFHELGFRDPNGQLVNLVEARTFPPPADRAIGPSVCGRFLEYSVATASLDLSQVFWESLGFAEIARGVEPLPWARLTGGGLTLGLYQATLFRPGPSFVASQLTARLEFLRAKGHAIAAGAPMFPPQRPSAMLGMGGAPPFYLVEDPAQAD
jgi:hypothetical protein